MDGYSATRRIDRASPRFRPARVRAPDHTDPCARDVQDLPEASRPAILDVTGRDVGADLLDLLADIRDVWRQGREILADPQGWR